MHHPEIEVKMSSSESNINEFVRKKAKISETKSVKQTTGGGYRNYWNKFNKYYRVNNLNNL